MSNKTYFNWSTGKDSSLAFYYLMQDKNYKIDCLVSSINQHYDRVSMHGIRRELLEQQVKALSLPLRTIELPESPSMEDYEKIMNNTVQSLLNDGFTTSAFGDIFLEDLRKYREDQLEKVGFTCVFPLWKRDTKFLLKEFLRLGFKAITVCINANLLEEHFVGRIIDDDFINDLPSNVDCCGENGEFHTFCYDGPIFNQKIDFTIGEKIYKEYQHQEQKTGFWFCDLLPK